MYYENPWIYGDEEFHSRSINDYYGFVYLITNSTTERKYVGKKWFYSSKTRQVKLKKKKYKASSNWQSYYGSSKELLVDVATLGKVIFKREILHLCYTKGETSYYEAKEQFVRGVLLDDGYYNEWIQCKIRKSHLKRKESVVMSAGLDLI